MIILQDGDRSNIWRTQVGVERVAQFDLEILVAFVDAVIGDGTAHGNDG